MKDSTREIFNLFGLVGATIIFVYLLPPLFATVWFFLLLGFYARSKNEAFWLAYYFVISDGFAGFFGKYEAVVPILPGLPDIEAAQLYIFATVLKAFVARRKAGLFHLTFLKILFLYLMVLVIMGQVIGIKELNVQFRVVKLTLPLLLLYSLPRLISRQDDYRRLFSLLFPVALLAVFAQFFTVITGSSPASYLGLMDPGRYEEILAEDQVYRGFYNAGISLLSFFAALYYLVKEKPEFKSWYLQLVIIGILLSVIISATRGWLLGLGIAALFPILFTLRTKGIRTTVFIILAFLVIPLIRTVPALNRQIEFASERFETFEVIVEDDVTMGGTEGRIIYRSPRVINKWRENPVFGWGFSDVFFVYNDGHVGNQNILLHSGIIGALLIYSFLIYFMIKLGILSHKLHIRNIYKRSLLIFIFFFLGWFVIHSTSGQWFAYYALPGGAIAISIFFTFGGINYRDAIKFEFNLKKQPFEVN